MPAFSEQIQSLCDTIRTAKRTRNQAVVELKAQTEQLLKADQQFLQAVHDDNMAAAERDKADRTDNCRERSEEVRTFRQCVVREQLADAEQQRQVLDRSRQDCQEAVKAMREGFNEVQHAFSEQCQAASRIWRQLSR